MGQTLTYGVYLPDEGERNCYSGLANNWQILDDAVGAIAGKANASHTHGNITNNGAIGSTSGLPIITGTDGVLTTGTFGNTSGTFCEGNDSRLSDARTPVAHTHSKADITDLFTSANTWTGANTFQGGGIQLKDISAVSAGGYGAAVSFYDYQGNRYGYIQPYVTSDNYKNIIIGADGIGRIQLNSYLVPYAANAVNLGTSDLQWNNIYSKNYYYNGTAWGLDTWNEWTGANVFQSPNTNLALQSTVSELGSLTPSSNWLRWLDKNGAQNTYISRDVWSDGVDTLRIAIIGKRANGAPSTSGTEIDCGIKLNIAVDGTKAFTPFDSNINLGTSYLKWKTLNGVNPGALSLPDYSQVENIKNISNMTFDGATGNLIQTASQTSNTFEDSGYLIVKLKNSSVGDYVTIKCQQNNIALSADDYPQFRTTCVVAGETIGLVVPVAEGQQPYIFATKQPTTFKFVKCYGNV